MQVGLEAAAYVFSGDSLRYILSEGVPFIIEERLYGDVYIFTDDYITKLMIAYDTDCLNSIGNVMSAAEKEVTESYHVWLASDGAELSGKPYEMYLSLDKTIMALVTCAAVPESGDCDVEYTLGYSGCPITNVPVTNV